jgi:hypothetical protein
MVTAALLFALLSPQEPALSEFLDGTDAESAIARRTLVTRGVAALPALARARGRKNLKREEALNDLLFEIKTTAAGQAGGPLFDTLGKVLVTVDMQNAPASAVLDYLREIVKVNLAEDLGVPRDPPEVTLLVSNVPFRKALDALCARTGLDYDVRCGAIILATPERLWATPKAEPPPALSEEQAKAARALIADFGSESPTARDHAEAEIRKLGAGAVPLLKEAAGRSDAELAARAKGLLWELTPLARRWSAIPEAAAWRSQKLDRADREVARKLDRMKIDLVFENSKIADILDLVRDFSELKIEVRAPPPAREVTFKFKDLPLGQVLELLILPLGLDVRIANGAIEIVERK